MPELPIAARREDREDHARPEVGSVPRGVRRRELAHLMRCAGALGWQRDTRLRSHMGMRKLAAIVVSLVAHAFALVGFALVAMARSPLVVQVGPQLDAHAGPPVATAAASSAVEVVLLDAPTTRAVTGGAGSTTMGRTGRDRTLATSSRPSSDVARGEVVRDEPARSSLMTMRGGKHEPALHGISGNFLAEFLARTKPLAPPPDIPGERLGNEIADVRARLRRGDRLDPSEVAALRQQLVALNAQRAAEELKPATGGTYQADRRTFIARVEADGTVHLKDKPEQLDSQDKFMLRHGIDPYARNKLAFLDRTRDQRVAVGEHHNREQLGHSAELMQRNIDRLWLVARGVAEQKQGLFELWDDCAEIGSDELIAGGAAARSLVIGVIRSRLHGADAYTAGELARLNAHRRSRAVFAPYD